MCKICISTEGYAGAAETGVTRLPGQGDQKGPVSAMLRVGKFMPVAGINCFYQGCSVGVGVARSRGNEPGAGVGVRVDQTAATPTPERFV